MGGYDMACFAVLFFASLSVRFCILLLYLPEIALSLYAFLWTYSVTR